MSKEKYVYTNEMVGLVFKDVKLDGDEVIFIGDEYKIRMFHSQDCCENVTVEHYEGLDNLINSPILSAEESSSDLPPEDSGLENGQYSDSNTWTLFEFVTAKGKCTILWHGQSNGYYSEGVTLIRMSNT